MVMRTSQTGLARVRAEFFTSSETLTGSSPEFLGQLCILYNRMYHLRLSLNLSPQPLLLGVFFPSLLIVIHSLNSVLRDRLVPDVNTLCQMQHLLPEKMLSKEARTKCLTELIQEIIP
jgi:hypothetical protein